MNLDFKSLIISNHRRTILSLRKDGLNSVQLERKQAKHSN